MKKKRSSVLQKLDSNFKSKLENLFGGRTIKKKENENNSKNSKKPKRKFKLKTKTNILTMPNPPLPPPLPFQNEYASFKNVDEIKVEKIDIDKEFNCDFPNINNNSNNNNNNDTNEIKKDQTIQRGNNLVYQKVIEKLITLNSQLIDLEIEKLKKTKKNWWDIEHKSFLLGVVTSLLSLLISYFV